MIEIRHGRWIGEALEWLAGKPLPEDPRYPDGSVLGDVVEIWRDGSTWKIAPALATGDRLDAGAAFDVLVDEVTDAILIHEDIAAHVDHDDDPTVRPTLRALRRLADRLEQETRP